MPYIISAGTFVTGIGIGRGVQSLNLSLNVTPNRLWHLGHTDAYSENIIVQKQLTIVFYAGASEYYYLEPSLGCLSPIPKEISIAANNCEGGVFQDTTEWWLSGYSYSKEVQSVGSETWNFISKPYYLDENRQLVTTIDIRMIRGVSEGQKSTDGGADTGVVFSSSILDETTLPFTFVGDVNVSQGSPGIGRANDLQFGIVSRVGLGDFRKDGTDGTASVTIPYTPLPIAI